MKDKIKDVFEWQCSRGNEISYKKAGEISAGSLPHALQINLMKYSPTAAEAAKANKTKMSNNSKIRDSLIVKLH